MVDSPAEGPLLHCTQHGPQTEGAGSRETELPGEKQGVADAYLSLESRHWSLFYFYFFNLLKTTELSFLCRL